MQAVTVSGTLSIWEILSIVGILVGVPGLTYLLHCAKHRSGADEGKRDNGVS